MSTAAPSVRASQSRPFMLVLLCGCLIALLGFGVRASFGLFIEPLSESRGWGREIFAFAIALQNLLWGAGQPLAGGLADRFGSARVLVGGGLLYALGVALMAVSESPWLMQLSGGVIVGLGLAGASFTVVLAALGRLVDEERRSMALGLATAAGSLGQFLFAPLGQAFIEGYGWQTALLLLAAFMLLVPALAAPLRGRHAAAASGMVEQPLGEALRCAAGHGSYWLLVIGFFVCGFHVAFITVHLPPYLADLGLGAQIAAWSVAVIGLFNVIGAYSSGLLGGRYSKRLLLSGLYAARALAIVLFLVLPPSPVTVLTFAAVMGLLWLSTVPLTSGLVAVMFGTRHMGTLFGLVFFSHQVGAFIGVWLGGAVYEATGGYTLMWWLAVALGVLAALVHWPIREAPAQPQVAASA